MELDRYEDLHQTYIVNWGAELGQGTYGKVYVGTKGPATGLRGFAIKMLRDKDEKMRLPSWWVKKRSGDTLLWACTRPSSG